MGGFGSGRHGYYSAPTCESRHGVDLASLRRQGLLEPGRFSALTWSRGEMRTGAIGIIAQSDGVRLVYSLPNQDGGTTHVDELVPFAYTPTRFGGRRQWLTCLKCRRRCRRIFGGRYFRCRQCHGLVYASTRAPAYQRAIDCADRIRKRVGGNAGAFDSEPFPPKPKRMRWRTYRRLEEQYEELQWRWTASIIGPLFGFRV
jgi:hypothetical protein